jgi:hypothetical protein
MCSVTWANFIDKWNSAVAIDIALASFYFDFCDVALARVSFAKVRSAHWALASLMFTYTGMIICNVLALKGYAYVLELFLHLYIQRLCIEQCPCEKGRSRV